MHYRAVTENLESVWVYSGGPVFNVDIHVYTVSS